MTVSEWIFDEWQTRVRDGKGSEEALSEVRALIEEFGRVDELWREQGNALLQHVIHTSLLSQRRSAQRERTEPALVAASAITSTPTIARQPRRNDLAILISADSVFDALIMVGSIPMRYGDMQGHHWEAKGHQYLTSADNATARHWACNRIRKRLAGDQRTEDVFTAEEFQRMIPDIGF